MPRTVKSRLTKSDTGEWLVLIDETHRVFALPQALDQDDALLVAHIIELAYLGGQDDAVSTFMDRVKDLFLRRSDFGG